MCFTKQPGGLEYSRVKRFLSLVRYATPISSITGVVILRVITGKSRRGDFGISSTSVGEGTQQKAQLRRNMCRMRFQLVAEGVLRWLYLPVAECDGPNFAEKKPDGLYSTYMYT